GANISGNSFLVSNLIGGLLLILVGMVGYELISAQESTLWRRCAPWLALAGYALASAAAITLGRVGFGPEQALSCRYTSFSLYLLVGLVFLVAIMSPGWQRRHLVSAGKMRVGMTMLVAGLVLLHLINNVEAVKMMAEFRSKLLRVRAGVALMQIIPHGDLTTAYPNRQFVRDMALALKQAGLLEVPLVETRELESLTGAGAEGAATFGELSLVGPVDGSTFQAVGWAILPSRNEQADAVILAYQTPGGRPLAFDYVVGPFKKRAGEISVASLRRDRVGYWAGQFSLTDLPSGELQLTAWAFDALAGKAYPLKGRFGVPVQR
ncbi:MAG: hypothetical protein HQK60_16650, partial [Deltaproteobacteria bacterium]|nr:hypothetical protein [Deltaproteobacteria bacterium]